MGVSGRLVYHSSPWLSEWPRSWCLEGKDILMSAGPYGIHNPRTLPNTLTLISCKHIKAKQQIGVYTNYCL